MKHYSLNTNTMRLFIKKTKSIYTVILLLVLIKCSLWYHLFIIVEYSPLIPRLLLLEREISKTNDFERKLFVKELEDNLINSFGDIRLFGDEDSKCRMPSLLERYIKHGI